LEANFVTRRSHFRGGGEREKERRGKREREREKRKEREKERRGKRERKREEEREREREREKRKEREQVLCHQATCKRCGSTACNSSCTPRPALSPDRRARRSISGAVNTRQPGAALPGWGSAR
jgi:hypothetical protein